MANLTYVTLDIKKKPYAFKAVFLNERGTPLHFVVIMETRTPVRFRASQWVVLRLPLQSSQLVAAEGRNARHFVSQATFIRLSLRLYK